MVTIGILDAKNRFSELLDRVEKGESFTITRRGKPVATIRRTGPEERPERHPAVQAILDVREELRREGIAWTIDDVISEPDEGRR